jgi:hypothetical protein
MMRGATAALLLLAAVPAHGAYSGLTLIPTTDVLGPGQVCFDYQLDGPFPMGSGVDVSLVNTQMGVGNRAEAGIDFDFTEGAETGAVFNGKLLLRPEESGLAAAVGVFNVGEHLSPTSYVAAGVPAGGRLRLHAGALRDPETTNGFGGLDYTVNDRVQVWAEYVAGDENASAISLAYQLTEQWGVSLAWQRPNDREADESFSLHVGCVHPAG